MQLSRTVARLVQLQLRLLQSHGTVITYLMVFKYFSFLRYTTNDRVIILSTAFRCDVWVSPDDNIFAYYFEFVCYNTYSFVTHNTEKYDII